MSIDRYAILIDLVDMVSQPVHYSEPIGEGNLQVNAHLL
jgi:hypothetical protein